MSTLASTTWHFAAQTRPSHLCRSIALQQNDINISSSSSSSSGYCYFYCYDDDCYSSSFLVVLVLQRLPPKPQRLQLQLRQLSEQLSNGQTYHHKHCNPLAHFFGKHASKHDEVCSVGAKNTRSDRISESTTVDREGRGPISPTWTRCKRTRETRNAHPDGGQRVAQATGDPAVALGPGWKWAGERSSRRLKPTLQTIKRGSMIW